MDKSGTSDPYVKFKQGGRLLFKSKIVHKELNPTFDETFSVPIEDPFQPINIKVRGKRSMRLRLKSSLSPLKSALTTTGVSRTTSWEPQS
jgi:Ca2+-dependent lipid-binding protein